MKTSTRHDRRATHESTGLLPSTGAATLGLALATWAWLSGGAPAPHQDAEVPFLGQVAKTDVVAADLLVGPAADRGVSSLDDDGTIARPRLLPAPPATREHPAEDPTGRAPRAGTERAFLDAFLALSATRPDGLDLGFAREVLSDGHPRAEKFALLRALDTTHAPAQIEVLDLVLQLEPEGSLPERAVSDLGRLASDDARARDVLEDVVRGRLPVDDPSLRRRAASHWAASADDAGLARLLAHLDVEQDALLTAGVAQTLGTRDVPYALGPLVDRITSSSRSSSSDG
ncbi:MAG: hypothetical protein H6825_11225 [Planctomycetes bacterium]|nr:hypothetical protein [Planctomycetota bacterium]